MGNLWFLFTAREKTSKKQYEYWNSLQTTNAIVITNCSCLFCLYIQTGAASFLWYTYKPASPCCLPAYRYGATGAAKHLTVVYNMIILSDNCQCAFTAERDAMHYSLFALLSCVIVSCRCIRRADNGTDNSIYRSSCFCFTSSARPGSRSNSCSSFLSCWSYSAQYAFDQLLATGLNTTCKSECSYSTSAATEDFLPLNVVLMVCKRTAETIIRWSASSNRAGK